MIIKVSAANLLLEKRKPRVHCVLQVPELYYFLALTHICRRPNKKPLIIDHGEELLHLNNSTYTVVAIRRKLPVNVFLHAVIEAKMKGPYFHIRKVHFFP